MALNLIPFHALRWLEATRKVEGLLKMLDGVRLLLVDGNLDLTVPSLDLIETLVPFHAG